MWWFQAGIPKAIRQLVSKLAECGWLFNKTKTYVENKSADKTFGLVGKVGNSKVIQFSLHVRDFHSFVDNITENILFVKSRNV